MYLCWHLYPLGFIDAEIRPAQSTRPAPNDPSKNFFEYLEGWLDYAANMHINTIQLGPIFASKTHGYDTIDHFEIDPRLGTLADFERFIRAARSRGLGVVLDGVFNHVAAEHELARRGLLSGSVFEGHKDLLELDHTNSEVCEYISEVLSFWLDKGISGWRLDAAYAMAPQTWARVLPPVRANHPSAWFVGEMIHGDYNAYVSESGLDAVTQYELWKAIWSSIRDRNFFELDWCLQRNNDLVFSPMTFVGNHDVTRIASQIGDAGAALALCIVATVSGNPSIYYGDEQAFRGVKEERIGGDDAVRPVFPQYPEGLAAEGWWMYELHQHCLEFRAQRPWLEFAKTQQVHLTNTEYIYEVIGPQGERLEVRLYLDTASAQVFEQGEEVLSIHAPQ
ncbi:alpha-amylase family glycosyl hydrolase [Corynebacterium freiburgense]|uniref:alpha-amylase family glycosyl hydrolase n=1 Tax=Corynebacterium freiburgense TaxID=556548 RepID=UPI00040FA9DF|nr:alpha-amylase family glycosyl hydrolase [Corynebacterium freiburgense]WJZ02112.1 Cyclomaltodextrinase [Corynebacterium freiburgense]